MSYPEGKEIPETGTKKKNGWIVAAVVLLSICALPVIVPLALCIGAGILALVLAGAGGLLALLIGGSACILGGLLCLAAALFCGVVGTGFGIVMLFSTPASGLAVMGISLMSVGAGVLGWMLVWQIAKLCVKAVKWCAGRIGGIGSGKKKKQASEPDHGAAYEFEEQEPVMEAGFEVSVQEQRQEEISDEA